MVRPVAPKTGGYRSGRPRFWFMQTAVLLYSVSRVHRLDQLTATRRRDVHCRVTSRAQVSLLMRLCDYRLERDPIIQAYTRVRRLLHPVLATKLSNNVRV